MVSNSVSSSAFRTFQVKSGHSNAAAGQQAYIILPPAGEGLFKSEFSSIQQLQSNGVQVEDELKLVKGYVANMTPKQAEVLEKKGYQIFPDKVENFLPPIPGEEIEPQASDAPAGEAPKEPEKFEERAKMTAPRYDSPLVNKFHGKGVTIAVIDSGVYPHPDLNGRLLGQVDFVNNRPMPYDDNGHGTHVSGCAAGDGSMSDGVHKGLGSEANIVGVKVLAGSGSGRNSDIIKGIQWCIEHKDDLNIRVLNMSLGGPAQKDPSKDPLELAVKAAYDAGIAVMVAAGNEGPNRKTVGSPGDSPFAITIGAADDKNTRDAGDDTMAEFSSRGPTKSGIFKPDLVAPGEGIYACLAPGTEKEDRGKHNGLLHESLKWLSGLPHEQLTKMPDEHYTLIGLAPTTTAKIKESPEKANEEFVRLLKATSRTPLDESGAYQALPGTSMATPIVAGLVASMFEANPELTVDQVKEILTGTADKLPGKWGKGSQGAGMVDPEEALMKAVTTHGQLHDAPPAPEPAAPTEETKSEDSPAGKG